MLYCWFHHFFQALIPGLTVYRIDKARKHEVTIGAALPPEIVEIWRNRMEEEKIDHFLDFVSSVKNIIIMTSDNSRDQLVNGTLDILRSVTCKKLPCKHAFENYNS